MGARLSPNAYSDLVNRVHDCIRLVVPPKSVVLIASRGDENLVRLDGYRAWHFPRTDSGVYAGHHPGDSADAIEYLRRAQAQGAQYLVFPSTSAWWLDHYREFAEHLRAAHTLVASDDSVCTVFELDEPLASDVRTLAVERRTAEASEAKPRLHVMPPIPRKVTRVLSILARHGDEQYPSAEQDVADIFARRMPRVHRTAVVVDNALPRSFVLERADAALLGGDNRAREFSAWDRALEFVGDDIWSYDLVHFATSAFNTLYTAYLDRFDEAVLAAVADRPVCVGHIDCYNDAVELLTFHSQHWIRSCFFVMPPTEVRALGSFVGVADGGAFFSGNPAAPFRSDSPLSSNYRDYIGTWLAGGDIGQGVAWHSSFTLTPDTLTAFEQKTLCILNEHLLAIRLRALGCRLIDVTWLSSMLRGRSAADVPWSTSWRDQLATRDAGAVVLRADARPTRMSVTV